MWLQYLSIVVADNIMVDRIDSIRLLLPLLAFTITTENTVIYHCCQVEKGRTIHNLNSLTQTHTP